MLLGVFSCSPLECSQSDLAVHDGDKVFMSFLSSLGRLSSLSSVWPSDFQTKKTADTCAVLLCFIKGDEKIPSGRYRLLPVVFGIVVVKISSMNEQRGFADALNWEFDNFINLCDLKNGFVQNRPHPFRIDPQKSRLVKKN